MTSTPSTAALDQVVLLHDDGTPSGTASRLDVHDARTPLHLAFSVHLVDPDGRTLLTRRALAKRTWPGVWTNSCCGHPRPGEDPTSAASRRVSEELGIEAGELDVVLPDFRYRAVDAGGVVENEVCPVHVALVPRGTVPSPDAAEVAEHAWVQWADLHASALSTPVVFSPWLVSQLRELGARPSWLPAGR